MPTTEYKRVYPLPGSVTRSLQKNFAGYLDMRIECCNDCPMSTFRTRRIDTVYALATCAALVWFTAAAFDQASDPRDGYAPSITEDSTSCYWDADARGNGQGRSFTTDSNDVVTYWEK